MAFCLLACFCIFHLFPARSHPVIIIPQQEKRVRCCRLPCTTLSKVTTLKVTPISGLHFIQQMLKRMGKSGTCIPISRGELHLTNIPWVPTNAERQVPRASVTAANTPSLKAGSQTIHPCTRICSTFIRQTSMSTTAGAIIHTVLFQRQPGPP